MRGYMEELVSIVIPIYKVEEYISNSINSVLRQTYRNVEIILVDDGTPDNSVYIADTILKTSDLRYRVIHQENKGLGEARNTGLREAKGEWVFFLDSDDAIAENTIEEMIEATFSKNVDFVFCKYKLITDIKYSQSVCPKVIPIYYETQQLQKGFLNRSLIILAPGTLYRRNWLIENNLWFEHMPWSEDQHFVWRALSVTNRAAFIDATFYQYLTRQGSIMVSSDTSKMIAGYEKIKELPVFLKDSDIVCYIVPRWVMGTLNAATAIVEYDKWRTLLDAIEGRKQLIKLLAFPDSKVRLNALLGIVSPRLYYKFNYKRRMRQLK